MPAYDFKCDKCGHILEKICSYEKAVEGLLSGCPLCGGDMHKMVCKGGGFRINGYASWNDYTKDNLSYDGNPNPEW
jgi:putative FmdB family regulatory protein